MNREGVVVAVVISVILSSVMTYSMILYAPQIQETLRGPMGSQGEQGTQGIQGEQGEQGTITGAWVLDEENIYGIIAYELGYYSDKKYVTFDSDIWKVNYVSGSVEQGSWYNVLIFEGHLSSSEIEDDMPIHNMRGSGGYCSSEVIGFGSGEYTITYDIMDTEGILGWSQLK